MPAPPGQRGPVSPVGFAVLGSELVGTTLVGVFLDWWLGTMPWWTVGGLLGGLVVVFVHMAQLVKPRQP